MTRGTFDILSQGRRPGALGFLRTNVLTIKESANCSGIWCGLSGEKEVLKIRKVLRNIFTSKRGKKREHSANDLNLA